MKDVAVRKVDHRNPPTAVDLLIEVYDVKKFPILDTDSYSFLGLVFIRRKNEPFKGCWALPGGFQEIGESLEQAAVREGKEETTLDCKLVTQLRVYSDPDRDPRGHVNSVGFVLRACGVPCGADDAVEARVFSLNEIPRELAFDHKKRVGEYQTWRQNNYH